MLLLFRAVVEIDAPVYHLDIIEGKCRRRARRPGEKLVDQVLKVVALVGVAYDAQVRLCKAQFLDHRRQTKQRRGRYVRIQLLEAQYRLFAAAFAYDESLHIERQRERIDADALHRRFAMKLRRQFLFQLMLDQRGRDEKTGDGDENDNPGDPPADPADSR